MITTTIIARGSKMRRFPHADATLRSCTRIGIAGRTPCCWLRTAVQAMQGGGGSGATDSSSQPADAQSTPGQNYVARSSVSDRWIKPWDHTFPHEPMDVSEFPYDLYEKLLVSLEAGTRTKMAERKGIFAAVPVQPPTVIFHLSARFKADTFPKKLNLGVGAYRDEALKPVVFSAVRKAEQLIVNAGYDKEYLPIAGLPEFRTHSANLLFGATSAAIKDKRIATCQTLSGTGSLTVAAHLLKRLMPGKRIFCSDPTWENHGKVVADAGAGILEYYRYWDPKTCGLDINGMLTDLKSMPEGSIVLLHAVAHNPTGVDPTPEQWSAIADVMQQRKLFPWFDIAYQGFASGDPDTDAAALRMFVDRGFEMLVCQSFAKNFGLYCERVGALHIVAADAASANAVLSNVEVIVRPMYSNPPAHGARVVATILGSAELQAEWRAELLAAMNRIKRMRTLLKEALVARGTPGDWSHVTSQIGMFSYTGLSKSQSERMVEEFHIYMLNSGRINVAGLNEASIPILADAIHAVVTGGK